MRCPKCGYEMSQFDLDCPRCARLGAPPPPPPPASAAPVPPPPPGVALPPLMQPTYPQMPPVPARPVAVSHALAWLAGCCPVLAIFVEFLLGAAGIHTGFVTFPACLIVNGLILEADRKYLHGLGLDVSSIKRTWLIPVYLFGRPAVAGGGSGYGVLWCVLFILSFVVPSPQPVPGVVDGQQIQATAHFDSLEQEGDRFTFVIVFDDGPLAGRTISGGGVRTREFSPDVPVSVNGTVHLKSGRLTVNPIYLTPLQE